jgi:hypothetical protein
MDELGKTGDFSKSSEKILLVPIRYIPADVGPFFHPAMGRVPTAFEPFRPGEATGALRSDPSRCITGTLRFAYVVGGRLPSALCGRTLLYNGA